MTVDSCKLPKTVSTRTENDVHDDLMDRCNKVGCRVSDYVKATIEFALNKYSEFDFGDEDENEEKSNKSKPADTPRVHIIERP